MKPILSTRILVLTAVLLGLTSPAFAQQQFQGTCARVKIEILQTLTTERIGFEATLEITNNESQEAITDFSAELTFENPELSDETNTHDASDFFFVRQPTLENINRIDGTGVVSPTRTAVIRWFIIPKPETGGTKPQGIFYRIGCRLSGKLAGVQIPPEQILVIPDTIQVKPEPRLDITYFQPRDVQGDDPFTAEVESPIPFTLGVLVKNTGYAPAKSVNIESEQPRIVENKQGLLLIAQLLGARVQDSLLDQTSLTVNLGDIPPGEARKGAWDMITSLSGEFVEFKASYTHASELGGAETSLIESLEAHFIADEVINDEPGRDDILDFLADTDRDSEQLPDALYESNGNVLPVNHLSNAAIGQPLQGREFSIDLSADVEGWGYVRLSDPGQAKYKVEEVVRSDGKVLNLENVWTNIRYDRNTNAKLTYLNLFDRVEIGSYSYDVTYAAVADDSTPPDTQLRFSGPVTEAEQTYYITRDTQMYFTSEDLNAVSIFYKVDNGDFKAGLPFSLEEPGTYELVYYAEDLEGNRETESFARLVLDAAPPSFEQVSVAEEELYLKGDALSARPSAASIDFSVPGGALPVDAEVTVYRGVQAFPRVAGIPVSPTPQQAINLAVSGDYVDFYRYRVNEGPWSSEQAVSEPIALSSLSGEVTLDVSARSQYGEYPNSGDGLSFSWTVDPASPVLSLDGLGPLPVVDVNPSPSLSGDSIDNYRWTIDEGYFRAPAAAGESFELEALEAGEHLLAFDTDAEGATDGDAEQTLRFTVDPSYGAALDGLPLVRSSALQDVAGSEHQFSWDGRDDGGVLQRPGWYTARIRVSNEIGQSAFVTKLLRINDLSGGHQTLAEKANGPKGLSTRSGWAVWQERPENDWEIRAQNFTDSTAPVYLTDDEVGQENPSTDGRWVVWQTRRSNGSYDIELFDLEAPASGAQALTATSSFSETSPVIDWPWVVFERRSLSEAGAPSQLVALNLADGNATVEVWPSSADQRHADVHAGRVVWQDFRDVGNGEIYYADLESGAQRRITNDVSGQFFPAIRGDTVVWQDNRDGQVDLYRYDITSNVSSRLTETDFDEAHPLLVDRFVIYEENSLGSETANLRILDLDTGLSVALTRDDEINQFGGEAGGHLVWQRRSSVADSQFELREAPLPALQLIAGNFNAVPVTQALAEAYPDSYSLLESWNTSVGVDTVARFTQLHPTPQRHEATWDDESNGPAGGNFPLAVGDFIWVRFGAAVALDLGEKSADTIDLAAGANLVSYTNFPSEYSAYELLESLELNKVESVRMLDARSGLWNAVNVEQDRLLGPNFRIPTVAVLMVEMKDSVSAWQPLRD